MALDRWVENGAAPEKIIASHLTNGSVDRTLPLCPYPQTPVYNGSGDRKKAESYHCEARPFWWALEAMPRVKQQADAEATPNRQRGKDRRAMRAAGLGR